MTIARLCTETLPTGSRCHQFALRGRPWCRAHAEPHRRERAADSRQLVDAIPRMDLLYTAGVLLNTVHELRAKVIPPLHAEAILDAAVGRLEELIMQQVQTLEQPIRQ